MQVIGVFKTHFDYGYTDSAENIRRKYREEIIEKVIAVCRETEKNGEAETYRWTLPAWLLMDIYDNCAPSVREALAGLIREDKITCHALPFTVHAELMSGRQMDDLRRRAVTAKPFQAISPGAKMTDVPGHTSALTVRWCGRGCISAFEIRGTRRPLCFGGDGRQCIQTMYTRFTAAGFVATRLEISRVDAQRDGRRRKADTAPP
ncbi:MAG: hypothetical protein ACLRSW_03325 [Christensenellaceae bacterium]